MRRALATIHLPVSRLAGGCRKNRRSGTTRRWYLLLIHTSRFPKQNKTMATRRRAREMVLQLLYEADINPSRDTDASFAFLLARMQKRRKLAEFAAELLAGTLQHRADIDERLTALTTNWSLDRMAVIDRNILRLGGYEILFAGTPGSVAITEAISLANRYGDKNSPRFINGVLDRVLKRGHAPVKRLQTDTLSESGEAVP